MIIVVLILIVLVMVILALSMIPEAEGINPGPAKLTVIEENKDFYKKIGVEESKENANEKNINKEEKEQEVKISKKEKSDIINIPNTKVPKTNFTKENEFSLEIIDWNLKGSQKNILVTTFKISNGFTKQIKNEEKLIKCKTFSKTKEKLSEASTNININIKSRDELILKDVSLGFVDIETANITCSVHEPEKIINIDTSLKPLNSLKKKQIVKKTIVKNNNTKGGFIIEGEGKVIEAEEEYSLPKL